MKQFSPACEENQEPILQAIRPFFANRKKVLEIGSGTGQHAVYFSKHLPHLEWQPSDRKENLAGINAWRNEAGLANLLPPLELDVNQGKWPAVEADAVFSANCVHIMSWPEVERMFAGMGLVPPGGILCLYGPFNRGGKFTSESNERFDQWLKEYNPQSGVRDFEAVNALARAQGFTLLEDMAMPANNCTLLWRR